VPDLRRIVPDRVDERAELPELRQVDQDSYDPQKRRFRAENCHYEFEPEETD
jgi:hypothetical protein